MPGIVLVTGGSGYIGSWTAAELLKRGDQVRVTVRDLKRQGEVRKVLSSVAGDVGDRLTFHAAELTSDDGWADAVAGCSYVLHIASPVPMEQPKDPDELIGPARDGALRVLKAAVGAGVRRVVMTSSVAATSPAGSDNHGDTDETVWTDLKQKDLTAYAKSKTIAERAAWDFMEKDGDRTELTTICPSLVAGPVLSPDFSSSVQVIARLMTGKVPGLPNIGFNIVDVRDLADLHIRAMTAPEAAGQRFIAAGDYLWMKDMAALLKRRLGDRAAKVPTRSLPDFAVRAAAVFDPALKSITPGLSRRHGFSAGKAERLLGWKTRSAEKTVVDCAESLIDKGVVQVSPGA